MPLPTAGSYDSIYDQLLLTEGNRLQNAQLQYGTYNPATGAFTDGLAQQEASKDYGFGKYAADNPYSSLAQLNRSQGIQAADQKNEAARTGNLMSGGYSVRRGNLLYSQGAAQDALSREYNKLITGYGQRALGAQQDYDANISSGWASAIQRKLDYDATHPQGLADDSSGTDPFGSLGGSTAKTNKTLDWSKAQKLYSRGKWAAGTHQGGFRYYRSPNGKLYKVWPSGRREVAK